MGRCGLHSCKFGIEPSCSIKCWETIEGSVDFHKSCRHFSVTEDCRNSSGIIS
jgi:hypothetical protein